MENFLIAFFKAIGVGAITYALGLMLGVTAISLSEFAIFLAGLLFINTFSDLKKDDELYRK